MARKKHGRELARQAAPGQQIERSHRRRSSTRMRQRPVDALSRQQRVDLDVPRRPPPAHMVHVAIAKVLHLAILGPLVLVALCIVLWWLNARK